MPTYTIIYYYLEQGYDEYVCLEEYTKEEMVMEVKKLFANFGNEFDGDVSEIHIVNDMNEEEYIINEKEDFDEKKLESL